MEKSLDQRGGVDIGNNVFIGMHSTILKGVHIGNNVIIGANSLVSKDIPDSCVAAGNPCRTIMSLQEYYEKRRTAQAAEAGELVKLYRERKNKEPDESVLSEFFWLFSNDPYNIPEIWKRMNQLVGNEMFSIEIMKEHKKKYDNMSDFLNSI